MEERDPLIGRKLGRYELTRALGSGGMGSVYAAIDNTLNREVAVKIVRETMYAAPGLTARFITEARVLALLNHPHIVPVFDFGSDEGVPYFVSPLVRGTTVNSLIKRGQVDEATVERILRQIGSALDYAHARSVIHRDIKPHNILLDSDGNAQLADFGIAKLEASSSITQSGFVVGSVRYTAPELFSGDLYGHRVDIYALGIVAYEMLAGQHPYADEDHTVLVVLGAISTGQRKDLGKLRPELPTCLLNAINKAISKEPELRFETAQEFIDAAFPGPAQRRAGLASSRDVGPWWQGIVNLFRRGRGSLLPNNDPVMQRNLLQEHLPWSLGQQYRIADDVTTETQVAPGWTLCPGHDRNKTAVQVQIHRFTDTWVNNVRPLMSGAARRESLVKAIEEVTGALYVVTSPVGADLLELLRALADPPAPSVQSQSPGPFTQAYEAARAQQSSPVSAQDLPQLSQGDITRPFPGWSAMPPPALKADAPDSFTAMFQSASSNPPPPPVLQPQTEFERYFLPQDKVAQGPPPLQMPSQEPSPGEFTRLFQTRPEPAAPGRPASQPPRLTEVPPVEYTRMFHVGLSQPTGEGTEPEQAAVMPDVGLTIQNCGDQAFIGRKANIVSPVFRIGQSTEADLVLAFDHALSRLHAEILFRDGGFWIRDLGSKNKTFLNGEQVDSPEGLLLMFGDRIVLGSNTQLVFVSNEVEEIADLTGKIIGSERFLLKERLHSSAKSAVYLAEDRRLESSAIVKILSPTMAAYPGYRNQFRREAAVASKLLHPHICPVIDFGEAQVASGAGGTSLYIAMRHLGGTPLQRRITGQPLSELERIGKWLDNLASALDYIHQRSITHGGVKPSSIVLDADDNAYLTDFAYATAAGEQQSRRLIGTPAYIAPERWNDALSTPAADRYSLGVLAYLLVTGFLPFESQDDVSRRTINFVRGPAPAHEMALRAGRQSTPPALSPVLAMMLASKPEERYESARAFMDAFTAAMQPTREPVKPLMRPLVFISHQRSASGWLAKQIKDELEKHGFDTFLDAQQTDTAGRFKRKIEQNIERCSVFLCLLTEQSLNQPWVDREIAYAVSKGKPMIPVFQDSWTQPATIDDLAPHQQELLMWDGVEFRSYQRHQVDASFRWLLDTLHHILQRAE